MSRKPNDATQLKTARAELRRIAAELVSVKAQREAYRTRATKAEQECADWQKRFDLLLTKAEKFSLTP